jgi:uncharacterized protein
LSTAHRSAAPNFIRVKVKPNARTSALTPLPDGSWVAQVKAPAIEGRANKELIALVAEHFHCAKAAVSIKSGSSGRLKLLRIEPG